MKKETKIETNNVDKHSGIPMSEESYKDWQKAFEDIEKISITLKEIKI